MTLNKFLIKVSFMDKVYKNKTFRRLKSLKVSDYPKFERQVVVSMSSYTAIPAKPGVYFLMISGGYSI